MTTCKAVIPSAFNGVAGQAGIHFDSLVCTASNNKIKLDPSFSWDDDQEHSA